MKKNNKGFTLVELLVTLVIFSLVVAGAASLIVISSRTFAKGNADANIQREAQLAVNQIGDIIIDCTGGVEFKETSDGKELILTNIESGTDIEEKVVWDKANSVINYTRTGGASAGTELLAENVVDFKADISDTKDDYDEEGKLVHIVQSVTLSVGYKDGMGHTTYATTPLITLRNRLKVGNVKMKYEDHLKANERKITVTASDNGRDANSANDLLLYPMGVVNLFGYDSREEVTYSWTDDHDFVKFKGGTDKVVDLNTDPDKGPIKFSTAPCFYIDSADRTKAWLHQKTVTFTIKVAPVSGEGEPKEATVTYNIPLDDSKSQYERGDTSLNYPFEINHSHTPGLNLGYESGIDYDFSVYNGETGLPLDKVELKELMTTGGLSIIFADKMVAEVMDFKEIKENGNNKGIGKPKANNGRDMTAFYPQVSEDLDRSKSYIIMMEMTIKQGIWGEKGERKETFTFRIPKVGVKADKSVNPWRGFYQNDGDRYGNKNKNQGDWGNGIRFQPSGYNREDFAFHFNENFFVTDDDGDMYLDSSVVTNLPKGYKVKLETFAPIPDSEEFFDPRDNGTTIPFILKVYDKKGNVVKNNKLAHHNITINSFEVNIIAKDKYFEYVDDETGKGTKIFKAVGKCPKCNGTLEIKEIKDGQKVVKRQVVCPKGDFERNIVSDSVKVEFTH